MGRTIISVSGYGATGASTVVDYLKGYEQVSVADDFEFQLHYLPDGINDLDYKINNSCNRFYDSDVAITRFLNLCHNLERWYEPAFHGHLEEMAKEYIEQLDPVKWNGYWAWDRLHTSQEDIDAQYRANDKNTLFNKRIHLYNRIARKIGLPVIKKKGILPYKDFFTKRTMYTSIKPESFYEKTQSFSEKLISEATRKDAEIAVINMLLPPQQPTKFQKYFSSKVKSIIVARDPRDLYIHIKVHQWQVAPYEDVETFIKWYKANLLPEANECNPDILRINFEDMIYDFDSCTEKICSFIGIGHRQGIETSFDPHVSVVNTKLFERYTEYAKDIVRIEQDLSEYLYDYSNVVDIKCTTNNIF